MILYMAINGYLDDVQVEQLSTFESRFHQSVSANHPEIGRSIAEKKDITPDTEQVLKSAIQEFKKSYSST